MIRLLDIFISLTSILLLMPCLILLLFIGYFDTGSPLFIQSRVGINRKKFSLMKFRTMKIDTKSVATHLVDSKQVTLWGRLLRQTKIDELPQLFNVLVGDMSIVGPRPCLFTQNELVYEREKRGVYKSRPGITGLAQIKGVDMSNPKMLATMDAEMLENLNLYNYFYFIFLTIIGRGIGDRIMPS